MKNQIQKRLIITLLVSILSAYMVLMMSESKIESTVLMMNQNNIMIESEDAYNRLFIIFSFFLWIIYYIGFILIDKLTRKNSNERK